MNIPPKWKELGLRPEVAMGEGSLPERGVNGGDTKK